MAGKKKAVKQAAKKAASDGKITQKEAAKVQQKAASSGANNAAAAIAKAAVNNQAKIASSVQASLGITQNKNQTKASFYPQPGSATPKPGAANVTGFETQTTPWRQGQQTKTEVPIYTFTQKKPTVKTTKEKTNNTDTTNTDTTNTDTNNTEQKPIDGQTEDWSDSVNNGMSELEAILASQMEANAAQTDLYMGMMQDMMSQMTMANQQAAPQGAYAVSAYQTPAAGAQTTKEIDKRKPVANDSLSIGTAPAKATGVGLNLAI